MRGTPQPGQDVPQRTLLQVLLRSLDSRCHSPSSLLQANTPSPSSWSGCLLPGESSKALRAAPPFVRLPRGAPSPWSSTRPCDFPHPLPGSLQLSAQCRFHFLQKDFLIVPAQTPFPQLYTHLFHGSIFTEGFHARHGGRGASRDPPLLL